MSGNKGELGRGPALECASDSELATLSALELLRGDIQHLSLQRHHLYVRAHRHRQGGQLVPASLCEELTDNESRLRCLLGRYTESA